MMKMSITKRSMEVYSKKYNKKYKGSDDERIEGEIKKLLRKQRHLSRDEFIKVAEWKSKRPRKWYKKNNCEEIKKVTQYCFAKNEISERERIESLTKLWGVGYRTASVFLHFAFPEKYPIMDFRVIRSLGWNEKSVRYNYDYWQRYCCEIKCIKQRLGLSIRTIDKALWKYDEELHSRLNKCGGCN